MTKIKKFREAAGLKQTELAEKIGISVVTLSRYENEGRHPRSTELIKMARLFGCTVDDLLGNPTATPPSETPTTPTEAA